MNMAQSGRGHFPFILMEYSWLSLYTSVALMKRRERLNDVFVKTPTSFIPDASQKMIVPFKYFIVSLLQKIIKRNHNNKKFSIFSW